MNTGSLGSSLAIQSFKKRGEGGDRNQLNFIENKMNL